MVGRSVLSRLTLTLCCSLTCGAGAAQSPAMPCTSPHHQVAGLCRVNSWSPVERAESAVTKSSQSVLHNDSTGINILDERDKIILEIIQFNWTFGILTVYWLFSLVVQNH